MIIKMIAIPLIPLILLNPLSLLNFVEECVKLNNSFSFSVKHKQFIILKNNLSFI